MTEMSVCFDCLTFIGVLCTGTTDFEKKKMMIKFCNRKVCSKKSMAIIFSILDNKLRFFIIIQGEANKNDYIQL